MIHPRLNELGDDVLIIIGVIVTALVFLLLIDVLDRAPKWVTVIVSVLVVLAAIYLVGFEIMHDRRST